MAADYTAITTGIWTLEEVWDEGVPVLGTPSPTFGVAEGVTLYIPSLDCIVNMSTGDSVTWSVEDILGQIVISKALADFFLTSTNLPDSDLENPQITVLENVAVPPEDVRLGEPCGSDFYPDLGELLVSGVPAVIPPAGTNRFDTYNGKAGEKYIGNGCVPLFYRAEAQIEDSNADNILHLFTLAKIPTTVRMKNMRLHLECDQTFSLPVKLKMRTELLYFRHRAESEAIYDLLADTNLYPVLPVTFPYTYDFSESHPYCITTAYGGSANLAAYLVFEGGEAIDANKAIYGYVSWEYWA